MNRDIRNPPHGAWKPTEPSPTPATTTNSKVKAESPWGQQTSLETGDDGQYHPNQQAQGSNQVLPKPPDNGQYHPNQQASGGRPNSFNPSNNWKYHSATQPTEGQLQASQQTTPMQKENAPDLYDPESAQDVQPAWQQGPWQGHVLSSTTGVASAAPTQQASLATSSPTVLSTATVLPTHPALARSGASVRAATIALSVIVVIGFIGALILLPLHRRRRRLTETLADEKHHPKSAVERGGMVLPGLPTHGARPMSSKSGLFGFKGTNLTNRLCSVFNHVVNRTRRAPTSPGAEREKDLLSAPKPSTLTLTRSVTTASSISDAGTGEKSKSPVAAVNQPPESRLAVRVVSSDSMTTEEQLEKPPKERTENQEQCGVYGPASLENPSIGNLLAASPLVNNVYVVDMDFVPRRDGQLELRAGQLLGISQVFDNGWALGVRLDRPEAGLIPRSHLSANPSRQQVQCSGSDDRRKSKRYSLPRQSIGGLSSRFYSFLSKSEEEPQNVSPV